MPNKHESQEVLIVGAGPVGMLLALELRLAGVLARVISRVHVASPHSKATIIWPRILELLDRTGLAAALIAEGHCFDQMNYYSNKKLVGRMRLSALRDTAFPFGITIPQWKTERILRDAMAKAGIAIDYGVEFIEAAQDEEGVNVTVRDPHGNETSARYGWLVGADGFRSAVRDSFDFGFQGFAMETRLAITDTEMLGETTSNEVAYFLHRSGNMVLAPLGDGVFRVGASVPKGMDASEEPDRDFFERLLAERVPGRHRLGAMRFSGVFVAHVRTAGTFRQGRVFLVGDAAHAMSPSGAQGLNTGFQDAVNLGWKLGGVVDGALPHTILGSYSSERLAAVERVSALSTTLARMSLYNSQPRMLARDVALRLASLTGGLDKYLSPRVSQLDSETAQANGSWRAHGPLARGRRIPLGWGDGPGGPDLALCGFTILLWPGRIYIFEKWAEFVRTVRDAMPGEKIVDLGGRPLGRLQGRLGGDPCSITVRPDGHIEAVTPIATDFLTSCGEVCASVAHVRPSVNDGQAIGFEASKHQGE